MKKLLNRKPIIKYTLMGFAIGLIGIIFSYYNIFGNLERGIFDFLLSVDDDKDPGSEILIVGVTEACLEEMGAWPWPRDVHGRLYDVLTEGDAAVIGMDIIFAEYAQDPEMDKAMIEATKRSVPIVYPIVADVVRPEDSKVPGFFSAHNLTYSIPELKEISLSGSISVSADPDGILRKVPLWMEYEDTPIPAFSLKIWSVYQGYSEEEFERYLSELYKEKPASLPIGDFEFPLDPRGQTFINYAGGPRTFSVLPYSRVIKGEYSPSTFNNKIMLVGFFALGLGDYYFTPFLKDIPMFGIEAHANMINTLENLGPINTLPLWQNMALLLAFAIAFIVLFQYLKPIIGFLVLLVSIAVFYIINITIFNNNSLYIETAYPVMVFSLTYLTSLGYTLITEQQERQRVTRMFGRYVAQQVVDQILKEGEDSLKLGGDRKNVSLLFIDIRGFTPLSEKLSPEEVVAILNQYFEIVTKCIFNNKGMVDKFMGDAVMAIFNAPMDVDKHAYWALRAAQDIIAEGVELQRKVLEMSGVNLYFGIGINTGDAVVGNIGAENRYEYTAIGDTVNLAARLESNAKPGQVLVSKAVYDAVEGSIPLESVGEIMVKGKSKPIQIFQLVTAVEDSQPKKAEAETETKN